MESNKMTDEEKKEIIVKSLTDTLNKISESVIKKLNEENDVKNSAPKPEKSEKVEKSQGTQDGQNQNSELTELIKNLNSKIDSLEKKFEDGVKTTEEIAEEKISKKKEVIQSEMVELVKSMGLDPKNIDFNFL